MGIQIGHILQVFLQPTIYVLWLLWAGLIYVGMAFEGSDVDLSDVYWVLFFFLFLALVGALGEGGGWFGWAQLSEDPREQTVQSVVLGVIHAFITAGTMEFFRRNKIAQAAGRDEVTI